MNTTSTLIKMWAVFVDRKIWSVFHTEEEALERAELILTTKKILVRMVSVVHKDVS